MPEKLGVVKIGRGRKTVTIYDRSTLAWLMSRYRLWWLLSPAYERGYDDGWDGRSPTIDDSIDYYQGVERGKEDAAIVYGDYPFPTQLELALGLAAAVAAAKGGE